MEEGRTAVVVPLRSARFTFHFENLPRCWHLAELTVGHGVCAHGRMRFTTGPVRLFDDARRLRKSMTPAERALWQELRRRKLGVMFRRQEPVSGYIVDFYASPVQVAVEVDGPVHDQQIAYDARRDDKLENLNVRVLRFRNEEVFTDRERVVARIREVVDARLRSMPFQVTRVRVPSPR